jgi:hypothetical protein
VAGALRIPGGEQRWSSCWFFRAQLALVSTAAVITAWISLDLSFESMGADQALLGFSGRATSCPAALMLLGATIIMAWQSSGTRRAVWQFLALGAGVLFTCSIGWARSDATSGTPWRDYFLTLAVSTSMMTLMTGFGLARVLPRSGDWIVRARQAMPAFGGIAAATLFVLLLLERFAG